jgi:tumor protein p53-inducible protein 3
MIGGIVLRAIFVDENTKKLIMGEWETPKPKENEMLVRVRATAVNRADLLQRRGLYPVPAGVSPILGLEMAGVVEMVGSEVTEWKIGDRVFSLLPGGGYAEQVTIPAEMAMRIPDDFSFEQAAAIPEVFLTAYLNLFILGRLHPTETVLIHAGASGVGTAAIQLAREVGATSIVTAGSEEKLKACKALGANYGINYKSGPFLPEVQKLTEGKGVNLILDFVGALYFEQNITALTVDGRLILIGTMGGGKVDELNLSHLLLKRIQIIGSTLRSLPINRKIKLTSLFAGFAMPLFKNRKLQPVIDSVFELSQAEEAHQRMEKNLNTGKIILRVSY